MCQGAQSKCRKHASGQCTKLLETGFLEPPLKEINSNVCSNSKWYCSCCCRTEGALASKPPLQRFLVDGPTPKEALELTELDAIGHLSRSLPALDLDDNVLAAGATRPPSWRARAQQEGVGRRLDATTNPDDDNCIGSLEGGVSGSIEPHERVGRIISLPYRALSAALRAD